MEGPGHVPLPALGPDPGVAADDLVQQRDLSRVRVHNLDLLRLEAQDEVAGLGGGQGVDPEPELGQQLILFPCFQCDSFLVYPGGPGPPRVNSAHLSKIFNVEQLSKNISLCLSATRGWGLFERN